MTNPLCGPITLWLTGLRAGEEWPATALLNECARVLTPIVRRSLGQARSYYEAEDILQSCLGRFGSHARNGAYPGIVDRTSLWPFLLASALNKLIEYRRRERRQRRGGSWSRTLVEWDGLPDGGPSPEQRVIFEDVLAHAIRSLPSESFRTIARLDLLEHLRPDEIALQLGCATSTVYRKLELIKVLWKQNLHDLTETGEIRT